MHEQLHGYKERSISGWICSVLCCMGLGVRGRTHCTVGARVLGFLGCAAARGASEGRSPEGRAFQRKQSGGLFSQNKPAGTPELPEGKVRCAAGDDLGYHYKCNTKIEHRKFLC